MKNILFTVLIALLFSNCEKSSNTVPTCTNTEPVAEAPYIIAFCNTNGIVATKDTTGIYY